MVRRKRTKKRKKLANMVSQGQKDDSNENKTKNNRIYEASNIGNIISEKKQKTTDFMKRTPLGRPPPS